MHKFILFIFLTCVNSFAFADQRTDIHLVLTEVDYLIDTTSRLQAKHSNDDSKILFNYAALIEQLETTRDRIAEYLNDDINEIRLVAPTPVDVSLSLERGDR